MTATVRGSAFERELLDEVSAEQLWEFVSTIAKYDRMSGSAEERQALDFIVGKLRSWNVDVQQYEHDAYVSQPVRARLEVVGPDGGEIEAITHSFSASDRIQADLVYVGAGNEDDYQGKDVSGKIVLAEGLAAPAKVVAAESRGAVGALFINEENFHQMIVSPVWGTPTSQSASRLPRIPVASVRRPSGEQLKTQLANGVVRVELTTESRTGWGKLPIVVGAIQGAQDPEHYVMLTGHIDSWFYGAMDNGGANATMLETMRILAAHRDQLRRGFRIVFISGHSHARYAGSTWFADTFWEDLHDHCVANVNVDSTGGTGATFYGEQLGMRETARLAQEVIRDVTGQQTEVSRIGRAGDQSFWGVGLPSLYMSLSKVPMEEAPESTRTMAAMTGRSRSATPWFWHTEHDTIDKIDRDILALDTRVYLATILRLVNEPILPLDYTGTVDEIQTTLLRYQGQAGQALDLSDVVERAELLRRDVEQLNRRIKARPEKPEQQTALNQALIDLGRILIPLAFTEAGPFEHDAALHIPVLPALAPMSRLTGLAPDSDEYRFLVNELRRRRNRVAFELRRAREAVGRALKAERAAAS
jgi:hypothetical protein